MSISDIPAEKRHPDGIHTESVGVGDGWAVETFPAEGLGYWFRIVRVARPRVGCPRRAVAEQAGRAAAEKLIQYDEHVHDLVSDARKLEGV